MAKDIPYYFADTGINGEMLGEQNVYSLPLTNTVLTSNIFNITINKTPNSASSTYFLPYDNSELGPVSDKSGIYRNEIFQLNTPDNTFNIGITPSIPLIISVVPTSSIINKYFLPYDNPELGPVSDKSGVFRNEIFEINNQRQYRYLVQDSTGSSYPVDSRYDQYYSYTKVISNFDVLSNLAPINLPISSSGSFTIISGYGYFDGSGSYLRISGSSLLNLGSGSTFPSQFTVEYDFYTLSASKDQSILSRGGGSALWNSSSGLVYNAGITNSKASWEYLTNNSSSYLLTSSTTISNNTWYTFAITYDGSITRLYLNGTLENYVSSSVYNYPSTLISSLTSSYIGRLVNTASYDYAGYLDKIRITTGLARYTSTSYISQSTNFPSASGFLSGSDYCNSNILTIRFVSGSITASNLIYPSGSFGFTGSQDILISNITGTLDNYLINKIGSGSNAIKRNDGITDKTVYTGDNYLNSTTIFTKGTTERVTLESSDFIFNSLSDPSKNYSYKGSGSNAIRRNDGITDKTIYTGDGYLSSKTINTIGNIDRIILQGSNVVINTNTNNFIPSVNKTFTYEVDYNFMFNQEIDSLLTIVTAYSLPTGFSVSSNAKRIIGYVNFTDTKTIKLELSDGSTYNIVLKPIFFKKKYTY